MIINQPTYAIRELPTKPITILKRERKTKSVLRPRERKEEISGVKFTYIRDLMDNALEGITWLEKDFDRALRVAIAYYASEASFDKTKYPSEVAQYFEELGNVHENDRLTHLILPRIMIIDEFDMSSLHKWVLLEDYYKGVQKEIHGNMLFVAEKDPQVYVDRLIRDYVKQRNLNHIIVEARGSNINNAGKVACRFISDNEYGWFVTRTDFCMHLFIEEFAPKIWVEMTLAPKEDRQSFIEKQEETRKFINHLINRSEIRIDKEYHEKQERITLYKEMTNKIQSSGFTVLVGLDNHVYATLRLASIFRSYNPQYDYVADLDCLEGNIRIVIVFSYQEIRSLYQAFLEKDNNTQTDEQVDKPPS